LPSAIKELNKLDKPTRKRINNWLEERILTTNNPRLWGKSLKGDSFGDYWCYRIGNYRILCVIKDDVVKVTVIKIGHRKEIYN
jgi:mRNA interferase RelE/StbE